MINKSREREWEFAQLLEGVGCQQMAKRTLKTKHPSIYRRGKKTSHFPPHPAHCMPGGPAIR